MRPGTHIRLPDGREATVVYHGLDGYGIRWGRISVNRTEIEAANSLFGDAPRDYVWRPEAMLRDSYGGAALPCVGTGYDVIGEG